jgi:hypothetical protein
MIATLPPTTHKRYWLTGARIWASWEPNRQPKLYEFIGTYLGKYWFKLNKAKFPVEPVGFDMQQLINLAHIGTFRPFLIDSSKLDEFIAEE